MAGRDNNGSGCMAVGRYNHKHTQSQSSYFNNNNRGCGVSMAEYTIPGGQEKAKGLGEGLLAGTVNAAQVGSGMVLVGGINTAVTTKQHGVSHVVGGTRVNW